MADPNRKFKDGLPINVINKELFPYLEETFLQLAQKPDLILSDFGTTSGIILANKYKIPLVVNCPILFNDGVIFFNLPTPHKAFSLLGFRIFHTSIVFDFVRTLFSKEKIKFPYQINYFY